MNNLPDPQEILRYHAREIILAYLPEAPEGVEFFDWRWIPQKAYMRQAVPQPLVSRHLASPLEPMAMPEAVCREPIVEVVPEKYGTLTLDIWVVRGVYPFMVGSSWRAQTGFLWFAQGGKL